MGSRKVVVYMIAFVVIFIIALICIRQFVFGTNVFKTTLSVQDIVEIAMALSISAGLVGGFAYGHGIHKKWKEQNVLNSGV